MKVASQCAQFQLQCQLRDFTGQTREEEETWWQHEEDDSRPDSGLQLSNQIGIFY